ncbi:MAG TPA: PaaI family thioesterase [Candidatus Baltobacteraceae bacterium]|nr:PaaI family thioesterase [Candidatus Baltobacteraceae bacterium]
MLLKPNEANHCFGCGGANARGMQLTFEQDDAARRIKGLFRLSAAYQGATGFVHGGIIATLLDEVMAKVSRFNGEHAVTAELTVEYKRPVPVDEDIVVEGWETKVSERHRFRESEIRDASGVVLARGRARFTVIDPEKFRGTSVAAAQSGTRGAEA